MVDQNKPTDHNAPNPTGQNAGGKVNLGPNEGGTVKSPEDLNKANSPTNPNPGVTQGDANAAENQQVVTEETKNGVTTITKGVDQEAVNQAKEAVKNIPPAINETQRLSGVPGNVNLTQNGKLNSDKSVREDRSLREVHEELNKTAGPNPLPLREGNELTKTMNGINPLQVSVLDNNTNAMADKLETMLSKDRLSAEDKNDLRSMRDELRATGKF